MFESLGSHDIQGLLSELVLVALRLTLINSSSHDDHLLRFLSSEGREHRRLLTVEEETVKGITFRSFLESYAHTTSLLPSRMIWSPVNRA